MANQNDKKKKNEEVQADNGLKPDPKTLHKTDPQENMEGPISSVVQNVKENVEEDDTTKEEADKKKEENM
ncbi:MAG: hypothetical protein IPI78_12010 [Chitinophagaceae bacterium]|nr:hypothetical protein [Chitinophagaceae bacterium]